LCPPLIIQEAHVDEIMDKLSRALDSTLDFVTAEGLTV
jgi:4-aminobutyrate--pyruvate transaminase